MAVIPEFHPILNKTIYNWYCIDHNFFIVSGDFVIGGIISPEQRKSWKPKVRVGMKSILENGMVIRTLCL